ncbi:MAG TPA: AraC family transcriptional regulator [Methylovirgula sp.]|nr:AraC family transcriptional regulator [Methylovirgula sp.]
MYAGQPEGKPTGFGQKMRRVVWAGGELVWGVFKTDEFTPYELFRDQHESFFMLSGEAITRCRSIDGKPAPRADRNAGSVDFFHSGISLRGEVWGEYEQIRMSIDPFWSAEHAPILDLHSPWMMGSIQTSVWSLIHEVAAHLKRSETIDPLLTDGVASLLAFKLSELGPVAKSTINALSAGRLKAATSYIDANLEKRILLSDLSSCAGLSTSQFAVAFRKSTGMPPHRFVVFRRIERAKAMLRDKSKTIIEIAFLLGFSSQSHFTQTFKSVTGLTPMQFRMQN